MNLKQEVPQRTIHALAMSEAFTAHWVFKFPTTKVVLSDNGSQFASWVFLGVFKIMGISEDFTSTYHPKTNGLTESCNGSTFQMILCYVYERQLDLDV